MNQLAVVTPARSDAELIPVLQSSLYPGASEESIRMALAYCRARGLDPMLKPVHIVPMYDKASRSMRDVILPGIPLYRIQAARTGQYAGKTEPEFGPDVTRTIDRVEVTFPAWCRVTVSRIVAGEVRQFTAKEFWLENYATAGRDTDAPNAMWRKRPYGQLAKCAEAQALRMAFPEEVGGAPTGEEMEGKILPPARGETIDGQAQPGPDEVRRPLPETGWGGDEPRGPVYVAANGRRHASPDVAAWTGVWHKRVKALVSAGRQAELREAWERNRAAIAEAAEHDEDAARMVDRAIRDALGEIDEGDGIPAPPGAPPQDPPA